MTDPMIDMPELPEYRDNPFIAPLPPLWAPQETVKALKDVPFFDPKERAYPAHLRIHCVARLARYFEPLERQVMLAERLGLLLRQGYVGRNPLGGNFQRQLAQGPIAIKDGKWGGANSTHCTASGSTLLGCSGIGKSTAVERILKLYPQVVQHEAPIALRQLVWVKIDCPYSGSPRQMCINFLSVVDQLLGTNYLHQYSNSRVASVDHAMEMMAMVARLHALGLLVIDEIQHLKNVKGLDQEILMSFLVTLVNRINVPVLLVGTPRALPILQGNFREARRASGVGSFTWEPLAYDGTWGYFVKQLWRYQWTAEPTPLTDDLSAVLHDASQGVIDVAVKLFMLSQMRLLRIASSRRNTAERIDETLFRKVSAEDLRLVQPMLQALRKGDSNELAKYDDLRPFRDYVVDCFASSMGETAESPVNPMVAPNNLGETSTEEAAAPSDTQKILDALRSLGIAPDVAKLLVEETLAAQPDADILDVVALISAHLKGKTIAKQKPRKRDKPQAPAMPASDLRRIVEEGQAAEMSPYESLRKAGIVLDLQNRALL
ncbi:AAA domain-containing protein [Andreprevotia lacus DSM 23236]|uniref:AAA domain-containing protein n=1 Tax=Andreprevotia lacus DSM 23236 TaxID=1121001 RepID=A0A1W1X2Q0_9NEIS|nr:ATP-binding protein [Andreprevotia lacus]SMC18177.1 AAA domain-containing protein [Andreprevotia lacus DSM 23236]